MEIKTILKKSEHNNNHVVPSFDLHGAHRLPVVFVQVTVGSITLYSSIYALQTHVRRPEHSRLRGSWRQNAAVAMTADPRAYSAEARSKILAQHVKARLQHFNMSSLSTKGLKCCSHVFSLMAALMARANAPACYLPVFVLTLSSLVGPRCRRQRQTDVTVTKNYNAAVTT